MFSRFMVIVNELDALGKTYTEVEKVMKILRSLPKKWETKVTVIQEAKDLTKLSLEELIGSLMTYEINLNNHQRVEENKKSIAFMASINDDEDEESESESDEDSMEEECTNEDANMCFMALEEHQDEVNYNSNHFEFQNVLQELYFDIENLVSKYLSQEKDFLFRTNDYISSVIRQDDFQSDNHKDKSNQGEIMKKKITSKISVFKTQTSKYLFVRLSESTPTQPVKGMNNIRSTPAQPVEGAKTFLSSRIFKFAKRLSPYSPF
ncbi:hypothetical protein AAG906_017233 [Vitis piasezkii]